MPATICPSCVAIREGTTLDLVEIDAASNRGIDAVRELRERLPYPPGELRRKVYILDEAHQITKDAWNALLKSLEEPPDFVNFMFASTEPSGFPPAILSRLQRYDVRRLTIAEIDGKLASHPRGRWPDGRPGRDPPDRDGSPPVACATPSRCSTSCCRRRPTRSTSRACATCSAWPTPTRSTPS